MPPAVAIAAASLAVTAVGTYASVKQGKKAAKAQRKANEYQRRQDNLQAARQKREQVRQARIAMAQSEQSAENSGVAGSSMALGAAGAITTQLNDNLSFLDAYNFLSDKASIELGRASKAASNAEMWNSVSGLALSVFGTAGSFISPKAPMPKKGT